MVDSVKPGGGLEENRLKRCLKGGGVKTVTVRDRTVFFSQVQSKDTGGNGFTLDVCHLSHGGIVLVTSDDDILSTKHKV
jgi:hypothetical protein